MHIAGNLILPIHINLMLAPGLALQLHIVLNSRWFKNIIIYKPLVNPLGKAFKLCIGVHIVSIVYREVTQNSVNLHIMKLEEAIVYLLASSGHGMKTEQIAREINERKLYERWDKAPVTDKQVYAVIMSHPDTFVKSEGRIRLMI